jgi:hypothetical protein
MRCNNNTICRVGKEERVVMLSQMQVGADDRLGAHVVVDGHVVVCCAVENGKNRAMINVSQASRRGNGREVFE